jgi:hypothetical protein
VSIYNNGPYDRIHVRERPQPGGNQAELLPSTPPPDCVDSAAASERRRASKKEQRAIFRVLERVYNPQPGTKYWEYSVGWDDKRVAEEANAPLRSVEYARNEAYGPLMPPPKERGPERQEMLKMRQRIEWLAEQLGVTFPEYLS